jgi:hypothetical protein
MAKSDFVEASGQPEKRFAFTREQACHPLMQIIKLGFRGH